YVSVPFVAVATSFGVLGGQGPRTGPPSGAPFRATATVRHGSTSTMETSKLPSGRVCTVTWLAQTLDAMICASPVLRHMGSAGGATAGSTRGTTVAGGGLAQAAPARTTTRM